MEAHPCLKVFLLFFLLFSMLRLFSHKNINKNLKLQQVIGHEDDEDHVIIINIRLAVELALWTGSVLYHIAT